MTQSLLDPPSPAGVKPAAPAFAPASARRRDPPWLFPAGFIASLLIHVLILGLFHFTAPSYRERIDAVRAERLAAPISGVQIVQVVPAPDAVDEPVLRIVPPQEDVPTVVAPTAVTPQLLLPPVPGVPPTIARPADPGSLYDRVRPRGTDPRLWTAPIPPAPTPESDMFQEALAPLYRQLDMLNDSLLAALLASERANDWTVTDENGGRWGVANGRLYLGKFSIPLGQSGFAPPPGRRDEINGRLRGWNEIQRQASDIEVRQAVEERIKAIRERKAAARDTTGGGGGQVR